MSDEILTKREKEIAEYLAWGMSKKEIAEHCFISVNTVDNTARNIFQKIGIQKATELAAWWFVKHGASKEQCPECVKKRFSKWILSIIFLFIHLHGEIVSTNDAQPMVRTFKTRTSRTRKTDDYLI